MTEDDDRREEESRRIVRRIQQESDPSASLAARTLHRARRHLEAGDADPHDRVELWGTRIGRVLGLVLFVGLVVWLARLFLAGQS
jgi:hypothetical protein